MLQSTKQSCSKKLDKAWSSTAHNAADELKEAQQINSAAAESYKFLYESVSGYAHRILWRYSDKIGGDCPSALWFLLTKLQQSALWDQDAARTAINQARLSHFGGNILSYLSHIDEHVKVIQQFNGLENDDWLCGALMKGLGDSTNSSCAAIIMSLKMERKRYPDKCDSSWLINSADDWYRDFQSENGFDSSFSNTQNTEPQVSALMASQGNQQESTTTLSNLDRLISLCFGSLLVSYMLLRIRTHNLSNSVLVLLGRQIAFR